MNGIKIQYSLCIKESIYVINPFTIKEPLELPPTLDGGCWQYNNSNYTSGDILSF